MSVVVEGSSVSRWRRRWPRILSRVSLATVALALGGGPLLGPILEAWGASAVDGFGEVWVALLGVAFVLAVASMALSYALWFLRPTTPVRVEIDAGRLRLVGAGVDAALADVTSAYLLSRARPEVEIVLRGGDLYAVAVSSEVEGRALVDELGFGRGGRRVHLELGTPRARLGHLGFGIAAYVIGMMVSLPLNVAASILEFPRAVGALGSVLSTVLVFFVYRLLTRSTREPEVTVGEDGIEVTMGSKTTFTAREDIVKVEWPVVFHRRGSFVFGNPKLDVTRREAFFRVLEDRMASPRYAGVNAAAFERGGRTIAAWREHVRRALTDGSYRAAGISGDDALVVLASSNATPEQRVGAALALGATDRVRVAADAIANPKVRVAVEAAIDAEGDAAIDKALRRHA